MIIKLNKILIKNMTGKENLLSLKEMITLIDFFYFKIFYNYNLSILYSLLFYFIFSYFIVL